MNNNLTLKFDPKTKINRDSPQIIHILHVKLESDRAKNCSLYRAHKAKRDGRTDGRKHPLTTPHANGHITVSPPTLFRGDSEGLKGGKT